MWVFEFQKYGKFWNISPEHLIKDKPLISEEWKGDSKFNIFFCFQKCLIHSRTYKVVCVKKKFCFCLFGYRSFFPGEQLRFIVRFSFCQKNIHIKDSIVVIKLIINYPLYTLQQCYYCMMWLKDQKILLCSWWCTHQWYLSIYLNYYYYWSLEI